MFRINLQFLPPNIELSLLLITSLDEEKPCQSHGTNVMNYLQLTETLAESFNALADEVQALIDHKTILEHKLRFAHQQVSHLHQRVHSYPGLGSSGLRDIPQHDEQIALDL